MLAKRGIRLNLPFLVGGGVLLFLFSLPQLYWHFPQVPWREVALGLFLLGSFSHELLKGADLTRFAFTLMAFLYLPWSLGYVLLLREIPDSTLGLWTLSLPLVASFATDIGAYFVGRTLGRQKLAPEISPGKTVEGSLGGDCGKLPGPGPLHRAGAGGLPLRPIGTLAFQPPPFPGRPAWGPGRVHVEAVLWGEGLGALPSRARRPSG